jgi:hypothetical protein
MKNYLPVAVVCVLVTLAAALYPRDSAALAQKAKAQWEYKAVSTSRVKALAPKGSDDPVSEGLTALGADGWELVAVDPPIGSPGLGPNFILKRPKGP